MRVNPLLALLTFVFTVHPAALSAQSAEPCLPQFAAAALVANLQDIALTTSELRLLNGTENVKLRRLLEWRLATAAVEARHHIDQGPDITARGLPSLASAPDRALKYIREHPLEMAPLADAHVREVKLPGMERRNIAVPIENLEYVGAWVRKQPWGAAPVASPN
jgi:hypothetical protein